MILDLDYRKLLAVSNSTMKDFVKEGPMFYYDNYLDPDRPEPKEWSTESTDIGDLTDCLLTQPKMFDKYYYISGDVKVSADFRKVLDTGWANVLSMLTTVKKLKYEDALKNHMLQTMTSPEVMQILIASARNVEVEKDGKITKGYRNNYGDEALAKYILAEGTAYYKDLGVANGRKILDQITYNIAVRCKDGILNHETVGSVFRPTKDKSIEVKGQLMVTAVIAGVLCKILVDVAKFDHARKIIWPKDVKTARSHKQFMINYINYDYANQGSFYTGVLQAAYPDYTIMPFEFLVGCTDSNEDPMIYRMSDTEIEIARNGATLKSGKTVKGWINTVKRIGWHIENDMWRYPKEFYDNGYILLNTYSNDSIEAAGEDIEDIF